MPKYKGVRYFSHPPKQSSRRHSYAALPTQSSSHSDQSTPVRTSQIGRAPLAQPEPVSPSESAAAPFPEVLPSVPATATDPPTATAVDADNKDPEGVLLMKAILKNWRHSLPHLLCFFAMHLYLFGIVHVLDGPKSLKFYSPGLSAIVGTVVGCIDEWITFLLTKYSNFTKDSVNGARVVAVFFEYCCAIAIFVFSDKQRALEMLGGIPGFVIFSISEFKNMPMTGHLPMFGIAYGIHEGISEIPLVPSVITASSAVIMLLYASFLIIVASRDQKKPTTEPRRISLTGNISQNP